MKAVLLEEFAKPPQLSDVPERAPAANEIVIATAAVSVNPADWKLCAGLLRHVLPKTLPLIPGLDVSGSVVAVGADVSDFRIGDRVAGAISPMDNGTYAERVTALARYFAKVPDTLHLDECAAVPTAGLTGLQLLERGTQAKAGQRILITGATGSTGRVALCAAKALSCHVIAAVRGKHRKLAEQLGADEILVLDSGNTAAIAPVDAIADTVGGSVADAVVPHLREGGIISTVATDKITPRPDLPVTFHRTIFQQEGADLVRLFAWLTAGKLQFPIARRMRFAETAEALQLQQRGGLDGKILLIP